MGSQDLSAGKGALDGPISSILRSADAEPPLRRAVFLSLNCAHPCDHTRGTSGYCGANALIMESLRDDGSRLASHPRRLKNCTARSCFAAAARELNVPKFRRLPVLGFLFRE